MIALCKHLRVGLSIALLFLSLAISPAWAAKNVIVMVSDGAGYNSWLAASMYQGKVGKQVYDRPGWVKVSSATYPLNLSTVPTGNLEQDKTVVYDPAKAWDATKTGDKPGEFAGYAYLKNTPTDSAASATAMATGHKTYNHAINWANDNEPMTGESIAEIAKANGKSAGVITTVYWCDATPAGFGGAHNANRDNYVQIANEMLNASWLDVIMGAGNPEFFDDGQPNCRPLAEHYARIGGKRTWELLKSGRHPAGWKLIQNREEFEKLADGSAPTPAKLLGVPPAAKTFQEKRNHGDAPLPGEKRKPLEPFEIPFNENKPTLAVMSKAAIRVLQQNPRGFFLMIEGGAVDWANHDNEPERTIEEQVDFVQAVETVVDWVERNSNWDDTLLILTADHECGLLWGPDSDKVPFQPLVDSGPGKMPGIKHNGTGHSNSLVPIYARGAEADLFLKLLKGKDEKAAAAWNLSGDYVENTEISAVMKAAVEQNSPVRSTGFSRNSGE
jgi:alkaline phosphatase